MNTGMTRGYRKHVIQPLITYENGKEFHLEVLLKLSILGFVCDEIPAILTWQDHKFQKLNVKKRKSSTSIYNTIASHLKFMVFARPVRQFSILSGLSFILGLIFSGMALYSYFITLDTSVYYLIVGLVMIVISLLFSGFALLFGQIRDILRDNWSRSYKSNQPPSIKRGKVLFP